MTFEILISTYGDKGLQRLALPGVLPVSEGVRYLISWQRGGSRIEIPQPLYRPDIRIVIAGSKGLGANRASCIDHARGDWCMIADDDLEFDLDGLKAVCKKIREYPELDFAIARSSGPDNKEFPAEEYDVFPLRRRHFVTEFELLLNLPSVRKAGINYNPNFGVGSPEYTSGEGAVFMHEMKRKGLKGRYFPIVIANHPGLTTSERVAMDAGVLKAEGVIVALNYPVTGILRIFLVAYRRSRRFGGSVFRALRFLFQGFRSGFFKRSSLGIGK